MTPLCRAEADARSPCAAALSHASLNNARLMAFDAMAAREKRRGKSSLDARARYPLWQRTRRPPPWSRTARSNLRRRSSERIVPDRGVDDVVVGRRIAPDSDEGLAFDVFVLGAEGHAAIVSLVDVLPEAHRQVRQGSVVRDAVGGRVAGK